MQVSRGRETNDRSSGRREKISNFHECISFNNFSENMKFSFYNLYVREMWKYCVLLNDQRKLLYPLLFLRDACGAFVKCFREKERDEFS